MPQRPGHALTTASLVVTDWGCCGATFWLGWQWWGHLSYDSCISKHSIGLPLPVPSVFASEHEARHELLEQSPKVSPLTMRISRGGTYCLVPKGPPSSLGGRVRQAGTLSPERNDTGVARRSYQRCEPDPKQYKGLCFSQHRHVSACYICFCAVPSVFGPRSEP